MLFVKQAKRPYVYGENQRLHSECEIKSALSYCRSHDTPSARMIEKGISRLGRPVNDVQVAIENVGNLEVAKLEKGLTIMEPYQEVLPCLDS
jgi:biopolymer transport protein ExbB